MGFPFSNFKQASFLFFFFFTNLCIYFKMSSTKANLDIEQRGSRYSKIPRSDHIVRSSKKRPFSPDGFREHPIIIDDNTESKTKIKALSRKRQRTNHQDPLELSRPTFSKFFEINQFLRSSKKIIVINGTGILARTVLIFEEIRKSK
ncbi:hypothetical protein OCU04_000251 [Sclerotinia nivalis]|uniref:Uncharacterized protein n=1 Tax=Sclerotinia nivalis TaxID=352851 RepID=A0A9X0AVP1_9HELO|nr:hypothetical protein OCU04_000251 [Sclerotinia nivalis]